MTEKDELQQTIERSLYGTPQLKIEEKRLWLGEFRERVILGMPLEEAVLEEATFYVERALKHPKAHRLLVHQQIPIAIQGRYMAMAKELKKEFRTVAPLGKETMGLVVVSNDAVDVPQVTVNIPRLPAYFLPLGKGKLCADHQQELQQIAPEYGELYGSLSLWDRLFGVQCIACKRLEDHKKF